MKKTYKKPLYNPISLCAEEFLAGSNDPDLPGGDIISGDTGGGGNSNDGPVDNPGGWQTRHFHHEWE